jgi:hypothetical protein
LAGGPSLPAGGAGGDLEFAAVIREKKASEQSEIPLVVLRQAQEETTRFILVELYPGELKPGRYSIAVQAQRKDGLTAAAASEFVAK